MAGNKKDRIIKVAGYAKKVVYNNNIEYRNFSPDLVGQQFATNFGTPLFTMGNFSITTNTDPSEHTVFKLGTYSKKYTLDDIDEGESILVDIQNNITAGLNLDLSNPLSYIWYGSAEEMVRVSLENIGKYFPGAIYVDNKVGSISGNNITNYFYDIESDTTTFNISTNYFTNPFDIKYTTDEKYKKNNQKNNQPLTYENEVYDEVFENENTLRNFTLNFNKYIISHNGIDKPILSAGTPSQQTNSTLQLKVEGNPFPEITGLYLSNISFLNPTHNDSIPFFIKPNEIEEENFYSNLNDLQKNILNRDISPKYTMTISKPVFTDEGVLVFTTDTLKFPVLSDGYNLNLFDSFYLSYLDKLIEYSHNLDLTNTDTIIRKYVTEAVSSFMKIPRGDGNDLTLDSTKPRKLFRIYGRSFDESKKYMDGIKFAHVVTYNKKNNVPDNLVKDLSNMLGLEGFDFLNNFKIKENVLPSYGNVTYSGISKTLTNEEVDIEIYRRLILNIAWLWKSKGARKAVEFLLRFIGAPESLINFNEYIVMVDKPLNMDKLKQMLFLYTGSIEGVEEELENIPYDDEGFPLPPKDGEIMVVDFIQGPEVISGGTNNLPIVVSQPTEMWYQKAGGWYRETAGSNTNVLTLEGNNPHVGQYDGGSEYLSIFSKCYIPNYSAATSITFSSTTLYENNFLNYNYGIVNGIDSGSTVYMTYLDLNNQNINDCLDVNYSIIETPPEPTGITTLEQQYLDAKTPYDQWVLDIQNEPYLKFSPEWEIVKNNYNIALNAYQNEINTQGVDINQSIEVCVTTENEDCDTTIDDGTGDLNPCQSYVVDDSLTPFIVFNDPITNVKVDFPGFSQCCEAEGGTFVTYLTPRGNQGEYCATEAPCPGTLDRIRVDGVAIFEMEKGNYVPNNIYNFGSGMGCYQLTKAGQNYFNQTNESNPSLAPTKRNKSNISKQPDINTYVQDIQNTQTLPQNFLTYWVSVPCGGTSTIVSSPECCAWHNLDFQINPVTQQVYCVQRVINQTKPGNAISIKDKLNDTIKEIDNKEIEIKGIDTFKGKKEKKNEIILKKEEVVNLKRQLKEEIRKEKNDLISPKTDIKVPKYQRGQNPDAQPEQYETIEVYNRTRSEATIVKTNPKAPVSQVNTEFKSSFDDPDLMRSTNWDIEKVDKLGRVTFSAIDGKGVKHEIDWSTPKEEGGSLYVEVAKEKELVFDKFKVDRVNNKIIKIKPTPNNSNKPNNPNTETTAAVDPSKISCCDINDVKIILGSNLYNGFNLPETTNQLQSVDISFDYMIKYDSQLLYDCVNVDGGIGCGVPAIFPYNSQFNMSCWNFAVFVRDTTQANNLINVLEDNTSGNETVIHQFQDAGVQQEFDLECCSRINGAVTTVDNWRETVTEWNTIHSQRFQKVLQTPTLINSNLNIKNKDIVISSIQNLQTYNTELSNLEKNETCIIIPKVEYKNECENDLYQSLISTNNVCALNPPEECSLLTQLYYEYKSIDFQLEAIMEVIEDCVEEQTQIGSIINEVNTEIVEINIHNSNIGKEIKESTESVNNEVTVINNNIQKRNAEITKRSEENSAILNSQLRKNTNQDVTVYDAQIRKIDDFDVKSYCNKETNSTKVEKESQKLTVYNQCVEKKQKDLNTEKFSYEKLKQETQNLNELNVKLVESKERNDVNLTKNIEKSITTTENNIDRFVETCGGVGQTNEALIIRKQIASLPPETAKTVSSLLNVEPTTILRNNTIELSSEQNLKLSIIRTKNDSTISKLKLEKEELEKQKTVKESENTKIISEGQKEQKEIKEVLDDAISIKGKLESQKDKCCLTLLGLYQPLQQSVKSQLGVVEGLLLTAYQDWNNSLQTSNNNSNNNNDTYLSLLDDLNLNFNIEVNNTNNSQVTINNTTQNIITTPYGVDNIWDFDYNSNYSGVMIEGSKTNDVISSLNQEISQVITSPPISQNLFTPQWQTFTYTLDNAACDFLNTCYPGKEFFISLELENVDCGFCILLDNIQINTNKYIVENLLTGNDCMIPELSCVIDNKRSWLPTTKGIKEVTVFPDGPCTIGTTESYVKLSTPENRLWEDLEYRYTEYDVNHSKLIINTKSTTISVDPAKSIECDVYNFWKNINCEECPTSCESGSTVTYEGSVRDSSSGTLSGYTLTLSANTSGVVFSCDTLTNILTNQVTELKTEYYNATANSNEAFNSTYMDYLNKGGTLSQFNMETNNCNSNSIIIGNYKDVNELFNVVVESEDGTLSIFQNYIYDDTTPYVGGEHTEILSGYTAQTFNQTTGMTQECCSSLNKLINQKGKYGLGVGNEYVWNNTINACTWTTIDNCKGDCEYSGTKKVYSRDYCLSGASSASTSCECLDIRWTISGGTSQESLNTYPYIDPSTGQPYLENGRYAWIISGGTSPNEPYTLQFQQAQGGAPARWSIWATSPSQMMYAWDNVNCPTVPLNDWTPINAFVNITPFTALTITECGGTSPTPSSGVTTVDVCINPLDYLEKSPSEIKVKQNFYEMILRNLIDAKDRQTISGYPLLQIFYQLYLNASNCGEELSGKLTYNNLFDYMDKVGDYWLDLIEQVVPATTIWEGCESSGKIYRNTIFDQNKYVYRKYNLNFLDTGNGSTNSSNQCPSVAGITNESIGEVDVDVTVIENCQGGECLGDEYNLCIRQKSLLQKQLKIVQDRIFFLEDQIALALGQNPPSTPTINCQYTQSQIQDLQTELAALQITSSDISSQLGTKTQDCNTIQIQINDAQQLYLQTQQSCSDLARRIAVAEEKLTVEMTPNTVQYEKQKNYISILKSEYKKCMAGASMNVSYYDKAFITQIYQTNEYEGNVIVYGDDEWDEVNGSFYNTELIHECDI